MTVALIAAASLVGTSAFAEVISFDGGNLASAANWDGGVKPGAGDTGTIFGVAATLNIGNTIGGWISGADLIYDNGATVTTSGDYGHNNSNPSSTFNDAALTIGDDIFANGSVMTFNAGSSTDVNDDFEANGLSILNINGGSHLVGDTFGAQGNNGTTFGTLNVSGGMVTAGMFRVASFGVMSLGGGAVLAGDGDASLLAGAIDIASDWTGSWTITGLAGTDWETEVTGGDWTLDGSTTIDATAFADTFAVSDGGQTLAVIPEPGTLGLFAAFGGALMLIRRRFKI